MIPENVIGIVIAIAMAFLGFLEWRKMSGEELEPSGTQRAPYWDGAGRQN